MSAPSPVVAGQTYGMSKLERLQDSNWSSYKTEHTLRFSNNSLLFPYRNISAKSSSIERAEIIITYLLMKIHIEMRYSNTFLFTYRYTQQMKGMKTQPLHEKRNVQKEIKKMMR